MATAKLDTVLASVMAIRARADTAAHNARVAALELASLQRQIEALIAGAISETRDSPCEPGHASA